LIAFVAGFVLLSATDAPFWLPVLLGCIATMAAEFYSRRTSAPVVRRAVKSPRDEFAAESQSEV